jgi:hypothetical protein
MRLFFVRRTPFDGAEKVYRPSPSLLIPSSVNRNITQTAPLYLFPGTYRHWGRSSHNSLLVVYILSLSTTLFTGAAKIAW